MIKIYFIILIASLYNTNLYAFEVYRTDNGNIIRWTSGSETFLINSSGGPAGSLNAIQAAAQTWTDVPTSFFTFVYGGTTSSSAVGINDGVNIVGFGSLGGTTIGENYCWYNTSSGAIVDCDIKFNTFYLWGVNGSPNVMDVQNTATHEFGHSLSLKNLYNITDTENTMYAYTDYGEIKYRTLQQDDIDGISYIYPQIAQYTLTMAVNPGGGGATTPAVGPHYYDAYTVVSITATPSSGYRFVNWTGGVANPNSISTTVTMNGNKTITANFSRQYALIMTVNPGGGGTTTPTVDVHYYDSNTVVSVIATPSSGYRFVNWTGGVANPNSISTTVTMNGNKTITANFARQYALTMVVNPGGGGTITPAVGLHNYDSNTVVSVTATPSSGYRFVNWTGGVTNPNSTSTTVTMNGNKTITANFARQYTLTMAVNPGGGTTTPAVGPHNYDANTVVSITATPSSGYRFVDWTGGVANPNSASTTVTMNSNKTITANFHINRPPHFITEVLPDAVEGEQYDFTMEIDDPDIGDYHVYELLVAPDWLNLNESGQLSGIPADNDVSDSVSIHVRVVDSEGLYDNLITSIAVINVNHAPEFTITDIPDAPSGVYYEHAVSITDLDTRESHRYELLEGPEWIEIDSDTGMLHGTPGMNDEGADIPIMLRVTDTAGLAGTLTTTMNVIRVNNTFATLHVDTVLDQVGFQESSTTITPTAGGIFGWALYIHNMDSLINYKIALSWDSDRAVIRRGRGPAIEEDTIIINGEEVTLVPEESILASGGSLFSLVLQNVPGDYQELIGGPLSGISESEGLLYCAIFRLSEGDDLTPFEVVQTVSITDADNMTMTLPSVTLKIEPEPYLAPPANFRISDTPNDNGNSIDLVWDLSPDDSIISHYYIYRSRHSEFIDPIPLESFQSLEALLEAELSQTIFIGKVDSGTSQYTDNGVPLNGVPYYYWIASALENGSISNPIPSIPLSIQTTVADMAQPVMFEVDKNHPNPFNQATTISFTIPEKTQVTVAIYDIQGRIVDTLLDDILEPGRHIVLWNASKQASGVYFYCVRAGMKQKTGKMLFLK